MKRRTSLSSVLAVAVVCAVGCGSPAPEVRRDALSTQWLADDFEADPLRAPLSAWSRRSTAEAVTLNVDASAAHRGQSGLRLTDQHAGSGSGEEAALRFTLPAPSASCHVRFWTRLSAASGSGDVLLAEIERTPTSSSSALFDLAVSVPQQSFAARGYDAQAQYRSDATARPAAGEWHLLELSVENVGTSSGARSLWIDGALTSRTDRDFAALQLGTVALGEPWADAVSVTLTADFDDVRIAAAPHASTLAVRTEEPLRIGRCSPVSVDLLSSSGSAAGAPYAFEAALTLGGEPVPTFADSHCGSAVGGVAVPEGEGSARGYVRPNRAGALAFVAAYPDFLSRAASVDVSEGPSESLRGWSCQVAPASLSPLFAAAALFFARRRRRPER